jgi:hypothetical protein
VTAPLLLYCTLVVFILILAHTEITEITEKRALHGSIGSHRVQMVTENDNPKNLLNLLIIRNAD